MRTYLYRRANSRRGISFHPPDALPAVIDRRGQRPFFPDLMSKLHTGQVVTRVFCSYAARERPAALRSGAFKTDVRRQNTRVQPGSRSESQADIDFIDMLQHIFFSSEEHTSDLQSLIIISYAVFCDHKHDNL